MSSLDVETWGPTVEAGIRSTAIRILFNTPNPALRGGPPTHLPILEEALRKLVDVHSYQYGRKTDNEGWLQKAFGRSGDLFRLRSLCRALHPDLVHHNSAFDRRAIFRDAPLISVLKHENVPVFIKIHGSLSEALLPASGLFDMARRIVLQGADCIGVLSSIEKKEFEEAFPCIRGKVRVVKNIIHSDFASVERKEAERPLILFFSRFIRQKGPFDLLRAVPLVLEKESRAEFVFIGDGEDAAAFDRELATMNLGSAVRRISHIDRRESLAEFARAWMLVFPTQFPEGMPMVIGEAMAAGIPLISTETRFSRSYMTEGVHVLYTKPKDAQGIAINIVALCRDGALRKQMSTANRQLASQGFGPDDVAQEYFALYQQMIGYKPLFSLRSSTP